MTNGDKEYSYPLPAYMLSYRVSSGNDFLLLPFPDGVSNGVFFYARNMEDAIGDSANVTLIFLKSLSCKYPMCVT